MANYDLFRKVAQSNTSTKELQVGKIKNNILLDFKKSPSYEVVQINSINYDVHILDESTVKKNPNKKYILLSPNSNFTFTIGNLVIWKNEAWLVTSLDSDNKIQSKSIIGKCNNIIKFYDKTSILNTIVSVPCIKENKSMGIDDNKYFINVKGKITVKVPVSDKTLQIYDGQRFIIDLYVYEVDEIKFVDLNLDKMSGYLEIEMSKVQEDDRDNFETGIAWNKSDIKNSYKITVLNGENLSTKVSDSTQLNVQVLNNNEIISPTPELTYISSNENICTVNNQGLINSLQVGECTITVSLKTEPNIKSIVKIIVSTVQQDNFTCTIIGADKIIRKKSSIYKAEFKNNGSLISKESIFELYDLDGLTPLDSSIAYIVSQDNVANTVTIFAQNVSGIKYFNIVAKSTDGLIVSNMIKVKIYSLI